MYIFVSMNKKAIILTLLAGSTLWGRAEQRDTFGQASKTDLLYRIDSIAAELSQRNWIQYEHLVYSDEIVVFENNQMPILEQDYLDQVRFLENEIPMEYNEKIRKMINYFGTTWQPKFKKVITLSQYYFPIYEEILDKNNLPLELKYLSVIESGLNPYAVSRSGATGLWQFMHATGKIFDLEISSNVDERRSVEKSTQAACEYFKQMYSYYKDWLMVMAAYNCGPGNLNKAIRASGGKRTFWEVYDYLPSQTQHYVPSFIAMAYMMNFYDYYGITPTKPADYSPERLTSVPCNTACSFTVLSDVLEIPKDQLLAYNPELKKGYFPSVREEYMLNLPVKKAYEYLEKEDAIVLMSKELKISKIVDEPESDKSPKKIPYTVRRGESLGSIAKKNSCTVSELKKWNHLRSSTIHPGQKLVIYRR